MLNLKSRNQVQDIRSKYIAIWKNQIEFDRILAEYTSFKIGGPTNILFTPVNIDNLRKFMVFLKKEQILWSVIGGGTNILISDSGFNGAIISLKKLKNFYLTSKDNIYTEAGLDIRKLVNFALKNNLSGLEFASGIPGSVGGTVICNAGGKYGVMEDIVDYVDCISENGKLERINSIDLKFEYRTSVIPKNHIIVGIGIKLQIARRITILKKMKHILREKALTQPLKSKSAGCIFKNPGKESAGLIIDKLGMKGMQIKDVKISEKHANFILNMGSAKASDVLNLIEHIKETVFQKKGIILETEIRSLGFEEQC